MGKSIMIYIIEKREEGSQCWNYVTKTTDEVVANARLKLLRKNYSDENSRYREVRG